MDSGCPPLTLVVTLTTAPQKTHPFTSLKLHPQTPWTVSIECGQMWYRSLPAIETSCAFILGLLLFDNSVPRFTRAQAMTLAITKAVLVPWKLWQRMGDITSYFIYLFVAPCVKQQVGQLRKCTHSHINHPVEKWTHEHSIACRNQHSDNEMQVDSTATERTWRGDDLDNLRCLLFDKSHLTRWEDTVYFAFCLHFPHEASWRAVFIDFVYICVFSSNVCWLTSFAHALIGLFEFGSFPAGTGEFVVVFFCNGVGGIFSPVLHVSPL